MKVPYVLFVHHGVGYAGGAPVSLVTLIRALKSHDQIKMKVVCHDDGVRSFFAQQSEVLVGVLEDPLTHFGKILIGWGTIESVASLRLFFSNLFGFPKSIRAQYRLFCAESPDLIHLNSATLFSSAIAARLAQIPVVWHVREVFAGGKYDPRRQFAGWLLRSLATVVVTISPAEAESIGGICSQKVRVIYNPYNTETLNPNLYDQVVEKERLGFSDKTKIILSLGGVSPRKGTFELIEAMSEQDTDTVLLFAGPPLAGKKDIPQNILRALSVESLLVKMKLKRGFTWRYPQRVRLAVNRLQNDNVHFIGGVTNVGPLLAACDVLVFAGTLPHFPRPVYEAGLMKKPVIVFDMQGITPNVEDGITGLVVRKISGKALGQAIRTLLSNQDAMTKMGEAGYQKARQLPNMSEIADSVISVYEEISSATSRRRAAHNK